jgi:hypothetical protein
VNDLQPTVFLVWMISLKEHLVGVYSERSDAQNRLFSERRSLPGWKFEIEEVELL